MEFLGVGPAELLFILLIILLVIGPKDIQKTARTIGQTLNKIYRSENYRIIQQASQELRHLPERLAREANLDELKNVPAELKNSIAPLENPMRAWTEDLSKSALPTPPAPPPASEVPPQDPPAA